MNKHSDWKTDLDLLLKERLGILVNSKEYPKLLDSVTRFFELVLYLEGAPLTDASKALAIECAREVALRQPGKVFEAITGNGWFKERIEGGVK